MKSIEKLFKVELPLNELLKLDGNTSEVIQKVINEAKKESSYGFDLPVMNEIIKQSEKNGKLKWTHKSIRSCDYCDKKPDYKTYPRSSRYHSKGDKNFNKPILYSGVKFNEGFITISGYGDMCLDCCNKHQVKERIIDYILNKNLKIEIMKNEYKPGKYLKDDIRLCYGCNEEMLESEMTKEMTLMGDGYYPSGCPKCGAKSLPFGSNHKITNKYGFIDNPESRTEVIDIKKLTKEYNTDKNRDEQVDFYQSRSSIHSFLMNKRNSSSWSGGIVGFNTNKKQYRVDNKSHLLTLSVIKILINNGYIEEVK